MIGVYLHIPYCTRKCNYCDFYSSSSLETKECYLDALKNQMFGFSPTDVNSVYFGGGTPSLLAGEDVARLLAALKERFCLTEDCEITLEMNPASCDENRLREYQEAGVNRLSIGIQSLCDRSLSLLGRLHDKNAALQAIRDAKNAGFANISADLMLALPEESEDDIANAIGTLAASGITHISAYLLKLMENTLFFDNPPSNLPDDDRQAELYLSAVGKLEEHGFLQYEISNFAKPGFESRHNQKYWNCEDYIGLGAAAHSSINGRRYSYRPNISQFINDFSAPHANALSRLTFEGDVDGEDYIMMRLRTAGGLAFKELEQRFGLSFGAPARRLARQYQTAGLTRFNDNILSLTPKGLLVSNSIIAELLIAVEKTAKE